MKKLEKEAKFCEKKDKFVMYQEKTGYMCFLLHQEKLEKEATFLEKDNTCCLRHTGLRNRWIFATVSICLRDQLAQSFRKGGKEIN